MKKGYTLMEVLVSISIIIIFFSFSLIGISKYKDLKNDIDIELCKNEIIGIINYGKQYCRENERIGYVLFDSVSNQVKFFCNNKRIDSFKFPKGVTMYSINTDNATIDIDKTGFTSDAGTIRIRDGKGIIHTITINVGVGYVEIK
jgi:type II secretory pathway pseudopilin PulG